jgi:alpha-amylase/alpha-mannosidase (GH57 family)
LRSICIHGHFYQPERANPWTGEIDPQESAAPYGNWNERITAEAYAPNAAARILGPDGKTARTVNNYENISFNFGPTLLGWLATHAPDTYAAVLDADRAGRNRLNGHGPAIAQMYGHSIAPLDTPRDRHTQAVWGIRDFEHRFGRRPEGIWLPETAVDIPTLETIAALDIRFTILAPHQAAEVRPAGADRWQTIGKQGIDPRVPYRCCLPSGRDITLFFYDGGIAHDVAFGDLLDDADRFADRLLAGFDRDAPQLVNIATDGETWGHHHKFGDMALAACIERLQARDDVKLTVYGEFLDRNPPAGEVRIREHSSWSCAHGTQRWQSDCGCNTGAHPGWNQRWRAPLRTAMNWLRDALAPIYEQQMDPLCADPWQARNDYVTLLLDRSEENVLRFCADHARADLTVKNAGCVAKRNLTSEGRTFLGLLEMQRWALFMFSSCSWFFDDISNLSSMQVMRCAARALELCREHTGTDLEPGYVDILYAAASNLPDIGNGAQLYRTRCARTET